MLHLADFCNINLSWKSLLLTQLHQFFYQPILIVTRIDFNSQQSGFFRNCVSDRTLINVYYCQFLCFVSCTDAFRPIVGDKKITYSFYSYYFYLQIGGIKAPNCFQYNIIHQSVCLRMCTFLFILFQGPHPCGDNKLNCSDGRCIPKEWCSVRWDVNNCCPVHSELIFMAHYGFLETL